MEPAGAVRPLGQRSALARARSAENRKAAVKRRLDGGTLLVR
jgi:hypothetical protein